jgi:hypothetical protein
MRAEQRGLCGRAARGFFRKAFNRGDAANLLRHPVDLFDALPAAPGSTEHWEPRLCLSVWSSKRS